MTHDDRVRHSWQKYDDRTASQSRPPMGRQFINCTSFILLLVLSILPLPLSLSLVSIERPFAAPYSEEGGVATRPLEPLPQWNGPVCAIPPSIPSGKSPPPPRRSFTMYIGRDETVPRAGPHRGLTPRSIIRDGLSAFNYGICYT